MSAQDSEFIDLAREEVSPPRSYWVISWVLLLVGIGYAAMVAEAFFLFTPDDFDRLVTAGAILPGYSDYVQHLPSWIIAISVFKAVARVLGGIALLLRKSWAINMYFLSFSASCVIFFRGFLLEGVASVERPSQVGLEALFFLLSIYAVWFAVRSAVRGRYR